MKTVLITGIARGIGLALAKRYLADGHTVIGSVRSVNTAVEDLQTGYAGKLTVITCDVTNSKAVDAALAAAAEKHPAIDVLICSAGVNLANSFAAPQPAAITDVELLDTFNVNVVGPLRVIRAAHGLLKAAASAKVAVISSGLGSLERAGDGSMVGYCISKAAVNMLCRKLHYVLEPDGIPVLAVDPGWVKTDMGGAEAPLSPEDSARGIAGIIDEFTSGDPGFLSHAGKPVAW